MKIYDFKDLIRQLPNNEQSFDIKADIWKNSSQNSIIVDIFNNQNVITISRKDLFESVDNLDRFVIKTLMWGYPTKGRGNNIDNLLEDKNFHELLVLLKKLKSNDLSTIDFYYASKHKSLGISTLSKFLYFLSSSVCGNRAVILDGQIMDVINSGRFEELNIIRQKSGVQIYNAFKRYPDYLKAISEIADAVNADPGQVELFLFMFGKNLKK
jgi:hypothetical protein